MSQASPVREWEERLQDDGLAEAVPETGNAEWEELTWVNNFLVYSGFCQDFGLKHIIGLQPLFSLRGVRLLSIESTDSVKTLLYTKKSHRIWHKYIVKEAIKLLDQFTFHGDIT